MANQRPRARPHSQRATAAGRSLARRKRSHTFVWTSAGVLSAVTKTESRRCVVARDCANLCVAWRVRLDHEPRRSPIDRRVCFSKWRRRVRVRSTQDGSHVQHYLSLADAFKGKEAPFDPKVIGLLTDWLVKEGVTH